MGLNLQMRETRMMGWMNQQRMNKDTDELTGEKKDVYNRITKVARKDNSYLHCKEAKEKS